MRSVSGHDYDLRKKRGSEAGWPKGKRSPFPLDERGLLV